MVELAFKVSVMVDERGVFRTTLGPDVKTIAEVFKYVRAHGKEYKKPQHPDSKRPPLREWELVFEVRRES